MASRFAATAAGKGVARAEPRIRLTVGERVTLGLHTERLHFFDPATGLSLPGEKAARVEVPAL